MRQGVDRSQAHAWVRDHLFRVPPFASNPRPRSPPSASTRRGKRGRRLLGDDDAHASTCCGSRSAPAPAWMPRAPPARRASPGATAADAAALTVTGRRSDDVASPEMPQLPQSKSYAVHDDVVHWVHRPPYPLDAFTWQELLEAYDEVPEMQGTVEYARACAGALAEAAAVTCLTEGAVEGGRRRRYPCFFSPSSSAASPTPRFGFCLTPTRGPVLPPTTACRGLPPPPSCVPDSTHVRPRASDYSGHATGHQAPASSSGNTKDEHGSTEGTAASEHVTDRLNSCDAPATGRPAAQAEAAASSAAVAAQEKRSREGADDGGDEEEEEDDDDYVGEVELQRRLAEARRRNKAPRPSGTGS